MIVVKPAGLFNMPKFSDLAYSWRGNSCGAGIMISKKGSHEVEFVKGLMTFSEFVKAYEDLPVWEEPDKYALAIHFRMATHGGRTGGHCHPFPVWGEGEEDMLKLKGSSSRMVMHNGVLWENVTGITSEQKKNDYSDTMAYVENKLQFLDDDEILELEGKINHNKLVIMDGDAKLTVINANLGSEKQGIWFSNRL